ncbi:unnamed protein product [Mytilus edulis]|uniref:Neurotransmitter-gated ion-channel ligand-binding domain-containing protein n=1 Tax=Mytilus edulis TaxID=6550 RepID=A0A8S3PXN7_MYTED|nr:unnamed protein product [Mytilus edulis]
MQKYHFDRVVILDILAADDKKKLFTELFINKSYNKQVRPANDQDGAIRVTVDFELSSIHELDEVAEKIAVAGYLDVIWWDDQLVWDRATNNDIYYMLVLQLRLHDRHEGNENLNICFAVKLQRRMCFWRNKIHSDTNEIGRINDEDSKGIENATPQESQPEGSNKMA